MGDARCSCGHLRASEVPADTPGRTRIIWRIADSPLRFTAECCPYCGDRVHADGTVEPRAEADRALKAIRWVEEHRLDVSPFDQWGRGDCWLLPKQPGDLWIGTPYATWLEAVEAAMAREASTDA